MLFFQTFTRTTQLSNAVTIQPLPTFLFTGDYERDYNRTRILHRGLEELGCRVVEVRYDRRRGRVAPEVLQAAARGVDVVFLPSFTHADVRFTKRHLPHLPLVFDPLISRYLTKVHDYRQVHPWSPRAWKNRRKDRVALRAADLVVTDTDAHARYFAEEYDLPMDQFRTLHIGAETDLFVPPGELKFALQQDRNEPLSNHLNKRSDSQSKLRRTTSNHVHIGFYGAFAPLQGVPLIVRAAHLLRHRTDLAWEIIGSGFDYERSRQLARELNVPNLEWRDWLPFDELPAAIRRFDIALGIFGDGRKTELVIPNKLYHYAACGRAIITADTPAVREVFAHEQNVLLCERTPEALAAAVVRLVENTELRQRLEVGAVTRMVEYSQRRVAERLVQLVGELR